MAKFYVPEGGSAEQTWLSLRKDLERSQTVGNIGSAEYHAHPLGDICNARCRESITLETFDVARENDVSDS